MVSEQFPGLLDLPTEDRWRLVYERWESLVKEVEAAPADRAIVALLEERHQASLADPTQAISSKETWERLEARKKAWR